MTAAAGRSAAQQSDQEAQVPPGVSVVVVARNEERNIGNCIRSLAAQDYPDDRFEVLIVDDGSTDRTVEIARSCLPSIRVLSNPGRSISRNRNVGWRKARFDLVAFIDADCVAPTGWLRGLISAGMPDGVAAVGGANRPPAGESWFYDALAIALDTFLGARDSVQGRQFAARREVDHLPTLNVVYRKPVLEAVGGFDERFARVGEDVDLSVRLRNANYRLLYVPNATVIHRQRNTVPAWTRNMFTYGKGRVWLTRRHPNANSAVFLLPILALATLPLYLPVIAACAAALSVVRLRPHLALHVASIFVCTHVAYACGQLAAHIGAHGSGPERRRRVALIALKNAGNKGDEAILVSAANRLVGRPRGHPEGDVDFYLAAIGPSGLDVRLLPGTRSQIGRMAADVFAASAGSRKSAFGPVALVNTLLRTFIVFARFDASIICGGQWMHDLSFRNHAIICALFLLSRLSGTRRGVFCVGAGPLRRALSRRMVRLALGPDALCLLRDERSADLLRGCGLSQASVAADPALELDTEEPPPGLLGPAQQTVALTPCAWVTFDNLYRQRSDLIDASLEIWRRIADGVIDRGYRVILLPTMNPEDRHFSKRLQSTIARPDAVRLVETEDLSPGQVQGVISGCACLVSMRLHPLIFASNGNVPFIALNYADKVEAFCRQIGAEDRLVALTTDDWSVPVLEALDRQPDGDLRRHRQDTLKDLNAGYEALDAWLGGAPAGRSRIPTGREAGVSTFSQQRP